MRRSPLVLAGLLACAGAAQADGNVTIFGGVDANITHVNAKGTGSQWQLRGGGQYGSRLGFTGKEDLGQGWRTEFTLESEFSSDTGASVATNPDNKYDGTNRGGGMSWSRKSTVGLVTPYGELRLGRDYTATFVPTTYFDPFFSAGVAQSTNFQPYYKHVDLSLVGAGGFLLAPGTLVRASNMVAYYIPGNWVPGLWAYVQHSFAEGNAPTFNGLAVGYYKGPLMVAASYGRTRNPLAGTATFLTAATASPSNALTVLSFGGSYRIGQFTLMGFYHSQKFDAYGEQFSPLTFPTAAAVTEQGRKVDDLLIGGTWVNGPHTVKAAYMKRNDKGLENSDADQLGLGYSYALSKRTTLYGNIVDIKNKRAARYNFLSAGVTPAQGQGATAYQAGLSHTF
jgi:predicted porin